MCHFDFDARSDATETDNSDGRLDSGRDGARILRWGIVRFE